ncbi:Biotin-requiring enzyme [Catalinimonas alkaloidigena]|uniref:Biotin-requiring enzyme n=1 Tax=Catalinimonas alkaloidigena TaxID=1075417 RepID=A0A1G9SYS4_9BACT|nr:lipoyl domain-containing protein [Catalinimonas alkaloidigena]SDM40603.1 Biotin-requiring enzyme [Catalinimonas alkaloidigena]
MLKRLLRLFTGTSGSQQSRPADHPTRPDDVVRAQQALAAPQDVHVVTVPMVGATVTQVSLNKWLVPEGGYVRRDQPLAELATEKASFEVNAAREGFVYYRVSAGETVPMRSPICLISPTRMRR